MLRRSRPDMQEDEIPEPEDHPDLEAERAFANAVIVEGMKRNPERAREVIADVARSFAERYSAKRSARPSTSFSASWKRTTSRVTKRRPGPTAGKERAGGGRRSRS